MSTLDVPNNMEFNGGSTEASILSTLGQLTLEGTTGGSTALLDGVDDPLTTTAAGTDQQLTNRRFVDSKSWKTSVRAASDSNFNIVTPPATLDGVTLVNGDRILLKAQTTTTQNGIAIYNSAGMSPINSNRASDAQSGYAATGTIVSVVEGGVNAGTVWVCDTTPVANFGSSISFSELPPFSGTPAGADTEAQFNNSSVFGAIEDLTYVKGTNTLTMGESAAASIINMATDTSHSGNVNILTGASATSTLTLGGGTINIGNSQAASVIDLGNSNTGSGVNILTGASTTGTLSLGSSTSTVTLSGVELPTGLVLEQTVGQTAGTAITTVLGGTGTGAGAVDGFFNTDWTNGPNAPTVDNVTNKGRITINEDGIYYVSFNVLGTGSGGAGVDERRVQADVVINGNVGDNRITGWKQVDAPPTQASSELSAESSGIFNFSDGDFFVINYLQNLGTVQTVSSTTNPARVSCIRLSGIS